MASIRRTVAAAAALLSSSAYAQTPQDFMPGTLVNLGVKFAQFSVDTVGSQVPSLDMVAQAPQLSVPMSQLSDQDGQFRPERKFMAFMIDTDVIQQNLATTVLHWLQPDLQAMGNSLVQGNSTTIVTLAVNATASALRKRQIAAGVGAPMPAGASPAASPAAAPQPAGPAPAPVPAPAASPSTANPSLAGANAQAGYFGPAPPPGPPHRYVLTLFRQPSNFSFPACFNDVVTPPGQDPRSNAQNRVGFDINQFVAAAQIPARPVAGTFFRAQNPQPGDISFSASAQALKNAMCPGAAVPGAPGPMMAMSGRFSMPFRA